MTEQQRKAIEILNKLHNPMMLSVEKAIEDDDYFFLLSFIIDKPQEISVPIPTSYSAVALATAGTRQRRTMGATCKVEKQGDKQKPAEYTLEQAASIFLDALSNAPYNNKPITDAQVITKELLKFLSDANSYNPNALNEQKQEWSEKDEKMLNWLCRIVHHQRVNYVITLKEESELGQWMDKWLNHNPQPHWEPSDEQMKLLREVQQALLGKDCHNRFVNFMNELKRLRDE